MVYPPISVSFATQLETLQEYDPDDQTRPP